MSTLRETVGNAVLSLHKKTGKEWIHLTDIYKEVENLRGKPNANNGASIRAVLETHSVQSDAFAGTEEYILKEKGTGLYKSIYYDNINFISNINIGDVFTRDQLMAIFKISGQSGMMKTNSLNCLVLTTSEDNGVYGDSLVENGMIQYTGEGLVGDQTITKNNKTLFESKENNIPVYLFTKDKNRKYIFEGEVELYGEPYQLPEKDINSNQRLVWKFPLAIKYPDDYEEVGDDLLSEVSYEINIIENSIKVDNNEVIFVDEPLYIRKYRKTGRKNIRTKKPDFIAQEIIKNKQGIINEKLIYEKELKRLMEEEAKEEVKKMEEFFTNKKENEGFDILSFEQDENGNYIEKYIEVKSTKGNENTPIDITSDEIDFAKNHINNYYLYRIYNSDSSNSCLKIVTGKELFNRFKFIPTTYKIYSE